MPLEQCGGIEQASAQEKKCVRDITTTDPRFWGPQSGGTAGLNSKSKNNLLLQGKQSAYMHAMRLGRTSACCVSDMSQ